MSTVSLLSPPGGSGNVSFGTVANGNTLRHTRLQHHQPPSRRAFPQDVMPVAWTYVRSASFDAVPPSVAPVRHYVTELLDKWELGAFRDDAELVVGELAANAVSATWDMLPPPKDPRLNIRVSTNLHSVLIEIHDPALQAPRLTLAEETQECGRGLMLVGMIAKRWSFYYPPEGGKVVWAEIGL